MKESWNWFRVEVENAEKVCIPAEASLLLLMFDLSNTSQKDGHPLPESYLVLLEK